MARGSVEGRFWSKVAVSDDCWLWLAARNGDGYGVFYLGKVDGKKMNVLAHRFSFELENGPISGELCHHCDMPACVRPSHLFLGDHSTNMTDMVSKGRGANGHARGATATTCHKGHPRTPGKDCPTCKQEWDKRYWDKNAEAINATRRERRRRGARFGF